MANQNPFRNILRSSVIVGSSSVAKIVLGLISVKAIAVVLGPVGVGLVGIFDSIIRATSTIAGLGLATSGVRQLSISAEDPKKLAHVRRSLLLGNATLGIAGGSVIWAFRDEIALHAFGDLAQATNVGWLGLGVFLTLIASSQTALLQGLRRIGDLAKATMAGAFLGAVGGVTAISLWGPAGLVAFVLLAPAGSVLAGSYYAAKLPRAQGTRTSLSEVSSQWWSMASLGIAFMLTTALAEGTQLFVRTLIGKGISLAAAGHFQASWLISMQYMGFILSAMAMEYYPRLSSEIGNRKTSNSMVNEQIRASLLLAGPVILGMLTLAPYVVRLLYSGEFSDAAPILRWQVLGDIFKIASWPMGFILIARAARGWFLFTQLFWNAGYAAMVWLGLPTFGLETAGFAFFIAYLISFILNSVVVYRVSNFVHDRMNILILTLLAGLSFATLMASFRDGLFGLILGLSCASAFAIFSAIDLMNLTDMKAPGVIGRIVFLFRRNR